MNCSKIYSPANTFIFSLDRRDLDKNFVQIPFNLREEIDINSFVENTNGAKGYKLTGIVSYYTPENKYVCFSMSPVDRKWYFYNDDKVNEVNINNIISFHNMNNQFVPCILAYKRKVGN